MNFGQNLYQWFLSNAQSLVLMAIVVIGIYLGFKREFSKLIGFLIVALIAVGLVFNADRVAYLESLGWLTAAQPSAEEALTLPTKFDEAYQAYLTLQRSQGFDLEKYAGETIKRYTYQVKNYPGLQENIWACLLVCKHQIIGGEIFCNQGDGFTQSLEFPMKASQ